jgi:hypothetical protein
MTSYEREYATVFFLSLAYFTSYDFGSHSFPANDIISFFMAEYKSIGVDGNGAVSDQRFLNSLCPTWKHPGRTRECIGVY